MDHLAILNKKDKDWLQLILEGKKTIESRWYKNRRTPWNNIHQGDIVYLKKSGEPVTAKGIVDKVIQFEDLTEKMIKSIYDKYGEAIGRERQEFEKAVKDSKNKRYCILIFLKKVCKVSPFNINKKGFGMMSAWISVDDISKIRR